MKLDSSRRIGLSDAFHRSLKLYLQSVMSSVCFAGQHFHAAALRSVSRAPMAFFETTPMGRVLARFRSVDYLDLPFVAGWSSRSIACLVWLLPTPGRSSLPRCRSLPCPHHSLVVAFAFPFLIRSKDVDTIDDDVTKTVSDAARDALSIAAVLAVVRSAPLQDACLPSLSSLSARHFRLSVQPLSVARCSCLFSWRSSSTCSCSGV